MAESDSLLTQIGPSSLRSPAKGIFAESPGQMHFFVWRLGRSSPVIALHCVVLLNQR